MNIYGKNTVIEALKTRDDVSKIIISTSNHEMIPLVKKLIKNKNIEIQELPLNKMNQMFPKNHQGIVATVNDYQYVQLEKLIEKNQNKQHVAFAILDGLEDPHNLGAVLRSADATQMDGIIIPKNLASTIETLKANGYWIIGLDMEGSIDYKTQDYSGKIAVVIGSEGKGISRLVRDNCDFFVHIPMFGHVNSLNASVSASIIFYEIIRNR